MQISNRYATPVFTWLGLACMGVLFCFAWYFYLERAAYLDLAFHAFTYIKTNRLFIQNSRFAAAITQIVPLTAIRAHASVDTMLRLYSLAFIGYYGAVFLISAGPLRNPRVALVIPLLFTLLVSNTFYWAQSELPQGLALLVLYYAGVSWQQPLRLLPWLLLAALVPAVIYCHPLMVIPFLFLWGYDYLLHRRFRDWGYYLLLPLALACYWVRMHNIAPGSYEAQRLNFPDNLARFFPHYLSLPSNQEFLHQCLTRYCMLPLVLGALTIFYLRQRRQPLSWLRLLWVWLFVVGYSQVVNISYPDTSTGITYFENLYLPLGLFLAVPLAVELLPAVQSYRLAAVGLALVFVFRLVVIWQAHVPYSTYTNWLVSVLRYSERFPTHKVIFDQANVGPYHPNLSWATAYETMLISARSGPTAARTIFITPNAQQKGWALAQPTLLLTELEQLPYKDLNPAYFQLPAAPYHYLNTPPPTDDTALRNYMAQMQPVTLHVETAPQTLRVGEAGELLLHITNPTTQPLYSGLRVPHPTVISYRFLGEGDWLIPTEVVVNPLELDVVQDWTQPVHIVAPTTPGKYEVELFLSSQGFADWPVRVRTPVEVTQ